MDQDITVNPWDIYPAISDTLLNALESELPVRWPNVEMPDRDIWIYAGQLKVLERLKFIQFKQLSKNSKEED